MGHVFWHYGRCLSSHHLPARRCPSTSSQHLPLTQQRGEEDREGPGKRVLPGEWGLQVAAPCGWTSHQWGKGLADYPRLLIFS